MTGGSNDPDVMVVSSSESSPYNRAFSCSATSKPPFSISLERPVVTSAYSSFVCVEHSASHITSMIKMYSTKTDSENCLSSLGIMICNDDNAPSSTMGWPPMEVILIVCMDSSGFSDAEIISESVITRVSMTPMSSS